MADRSRIDLMRVHKNITALRRQRSSTRLKWFKRVFFALIAATGFFLLGYLIAALSIGTWAKILLLVLMAILGFVSSHLVTAVFH